MLLRFARQTLILKHVKEHLLHCTFTVYRIVLGVHQKLASLASWTQSVE